MKNKDSSSLVGFVLIAIVLIFFNVFIFPKFQPEEKETASQSVQDFSQNDNLLKNEEVLENIISEKLFTLENENSTNREEQEKSRNVHWHLLSI